MLSIFQLWGNNPWNLPVPHSLKQTCHIHSYETCDPLKRLHLLWVLYATSTVFHALVLVQLGVSSKRNSVCLQLELIPVCVCNKLLYDFFRLGWSNQRYERNLLFKTRLQLFADSIFKQSVLGCYYVKLCNYAICSNCGKTVQVFGNILKKNLHLLLKHILVFGDIGFTSFNSHASSTPLLCSRVTHLVQSDAEAPDRIFECELKFGCLMQSSRVTQHFTCNKCCL